MLLTHTGGKWNKPKHTHTHTHTHTVTHIPPQVHYTMAEITIVPVAESKSSKSEPAKTEPAKTEKKTRKTVVVDIKPPESGNKRGVKRWSLYPRPCSTQNQCSISRVALKTHGVSVCWSLVHGRFENVRVLLWMHQIRQAERSKKLRVWMWRSIHQTLP